MLKSVSKEIAPLMYENMPKKERSKINSATIKLLLKIKAFINRRNAFLTRRSLMIQERYLYLAQEQ